MISEQEQERIRLLSDNELYPQAVEFLQKMGQPLPPTQINGLLNASLANTYPQFQEFIRRQGARKTWPASEQHVAAFYRTRFPAVLRQLESYVPAVTRLAQEQISGEHRQAVQMELAREFIQHLLAENGYKDATGGFQRPGEPPQSRQDSPGRFQSHGRGGQRR